MTPPRPPRARLRAATTLLTALAALSAAALTAAASPAAADGAKDVSYRGYHVRVPSSWPVIDLAAAPETCVHFDRHAVYLGHPTDAGQATCPPGLVGRTEALVIESLDAKGLKSLDSSTRIAPKGAAKAAATDSRGASTGRIRQAVPAAGVLVTASVGGDEPAVQNILDSAGLDADAKAVPLSGTSAGHDPSASVTAASAVAPQPGTYTGLGFDPCAAPSNAQMSAWSASPFRAIGVYISGISAACDQPNLTAPWIQTQTSAGWHIIPIHVGLQAPCNTYTHKVSYTLSTAASQGRAAAQESVAAAAALGMPQGSVLYNDMEAYDQNNAACSNAVLTYISAWTEELHADGYLSGEYSSAASGMADLAAEYTTGTYTMPDHIWFARWNSQADTDAKPYVPDGYWADHQRIHQLTGDTDETWGGVTINIDRDYLDVGLGPFAGSCSAGLDFSLYGSISAGSSGGLVSAAQCLLTRQGHYSGTVDGAFGSGTTAAVQSYQTATALPVTGTVDSHTWTALLAAGTKPTLQSGATGADVQRLQRALIAARGQTLTIDGDFGPATTTAVKAYQTAQGLTSDGIVGNATWTALQAGK
ncbi:glycoside hydrolase domain-containing protein [Streptomyces sp. NPDC060035]|uniref:glycoside hydrolase domain-containing protein n=1 Tax=Streptomyces sp. NPDC060035 TaxID=3347044 RepID=UPI0036D03C41